MKLLKELLWKKQPIPRASERRPAPDFVIYCSSGPTSDPETIKNISSTGVYIFTEERWLPGTIVPLTLQRSGPHEENPERRVTLKGRVVWWGQDGVGLAFKLPPDLNFDLWEAVLASAEGKGTHDDILSPFRLAEALAFFARICPSATDELKRLVLTEIGNVRTTHAVAMALEAEQLLAGDPNADRMRADPDVIRRIIEYGSWADEDRVRHLWAGLLTTYCNPDEVSDSDPDLVERFSQLAGVHVCIFEEACKRATKTLSETGEVRAEKLIITVSEILQFTGLQTAARIESDIHHIAEAGLIVWIRHSPSLLPAEQAAVTPSSIGLSLYARCHGYRSAPAGFYGLVEAAGAEQA